MKHFVISWLLAFPCALLMLGPSGVFSNYCSSKGPLSLMFIAAEKVYFGSQSGKLFSFDLNSKKHSTVEAVKEFGEKMPAITIGVHFDPFDSCNPKMSNPEFCKRSPVFHDMAVLVGGGQMSMLNVEKKKFVPYRHTNEFEEKNAILPSVNSRLYSALYLLFSQVATSTNPKFTGATYDQSTDTLYLAATVDDAVAKLAEWNVGKHVLFRANFSGNGLLQDCFVVAKFDQAVNGLIDLKGNLFALTENNSIIQLDGASYQVSKTYEPAAFFGCSKEDSPIMKNFKENDHVNRTNAGLVIPSLGQLFFPHQPDQLKYVDSNLLTGGTFVAIVVVLSVLLVVIVAVDVYIVYSMNQDADENDAYNDSNSVKSRRSSPSSRSSKRSKSKSKSHTRA